MLFNSFVFIFAFLPIAFLGYFALTKLRLIIAARAFLVVTSLFFYAFYNIFYLPIIVFSMIFNFYVGLILQNHSLSLSKNSAKILLNRWNFWEFRAAWIF